MSEVDTGDKVAVSMGFKKNLGNYENIDFYSSVTVTVRDGETREDTFKRAWSIVDNELEEKVAEATELVNSKKK